MRYRRENDSNWPVVLVLIVITITVASILILEAMGKLREYLQL